MIREHSRALSQPCHAFHTVCGARHPGAIGAPPCRLLPALPMSSNTCCHRDKSEQELVRAGGADLDGPTGQYRVLRCFRVEVRGTAFAMSRRPCRSGAFNRGNNNNLLHPYINIKPGAEPRKLCRTSGRSRCCTCRRGRTGPAASWRPAAHGSRRSAMRDNRVDTRTGCSRPATISFWHGRSCRQPASSVLL